jgi:hypothetical protein
VKRLFLTLSALALGLAGTLLLPSSAQATTFATTVKTSSDMKGCPTSGTGCAETGDALAGDKVTDFCLRGSFDLIYNAASGRRLGFVLRSTLNSGNQFTDCSSGGLFTNVASTTTLRACPNNACPSTGSATSAHQLRAYCNIAGTVVDGDNLWYAVYNSSSGQRAGFIPHARMNNQPLSPAC